MRNFISASQLTQLLEILFVLCIDYMESGPTGKPDKETKEEIKLLGPSVLRQWGKQLSSLKDALNACLTGNNKVEKLVILGQDIKHEFEAFRSNQRFTAQELETLKAIGSYLRTDSESALRKLQKMAGIVASPFVSKRLAPSLRSQEQTGDSLRRLIYEMVGRDDTALTLDEAKQVKELHPDLYKQYLLYRREHNQVWKDALVNYIRKSGHKTVPYEELIAYLHANGIDHMLPTGFTGEIDDLGRLYTNKGQLIDGVPNAVTFPSVIMNKNYGRSNGGDYIFQAVRSDGQPGSYFYTTEYKKGAAKEKFAKVADLAPKIESMQKKWFTKVKHFNIEDPQCICAVILELLYEFSARIGSMGNAAGGQSTFGISTLLIKHVSVNESGMTLRYKGKDGVNTVHKLSNSDPVQHIVIQDILQLMEGKQAKDRLFTVTKNGRFVPIGGMAVNQYFKSLGAPEGTSVHKLRTFRGGKLFTELTQKIFSKKIPKTEKDAMQIFKKIAEQVGKLLNHVRRGQSGQKVTGTTALNSYIDHSSQIAYWQALGFRPPKYLEKHMDFE